MIFGWSAILLGWLLSFHRRRVTAFEGCLFGISGGFGIGFWISKFIA
jgi:hypothetical protein